MMYKAKVAEIRTKHSKQSEHHVEFFNPLNTKRRLLYLKTQYVPHCKLFPPRL